MNNSWFDKGFDGVNDDFFEDIIKYLDFPLEDVEENDGSGGSSGEGVIKNFHLPIDVVEPKNCGGGGEEWHCNFQNLEPPPANVLAGMSSGFCGDFFSDNLPKSLTVSYDGSSQLNQWSSTTEASSSRSVTLHCDSSYVKVSTRFQTSSPVSVLESSSTCSAANPTPITPKLGFLVKRSRSKRRRASSFNQNFTLPFTSSTSRRSNYLAGSESEPESHLTEELAKKRPKKKNNLTWYSGFNEIKKSPYQRKPIEVRKCLHCEVTKTPQWREGPMGPKTLCNACGVRYRSGSLLPEYRPAASPTFVPDLHSNSHKKVIEMRKKSQFGDD